MKTDKELYRIFAAVPDWLFQLTGLPSPGKCSLRSFTVKALQRDADGVVVPEDVSQPLTVVEFQFQKDDTIYNRTVAEMIAVQEANGMRPVQGLIFFQNDSLDPRTKPWNHVVKTFVLRDLLDRLEREQPDHPLVAVFKPLQIVQAGTLEAEAVRHYRTIKNSKLPASVKTALLTVFVSWVQQRFKSKRKQEIEVMLGLNELPGLEETESGKDLIRIGEERAILVFLKAKFKTVPRVVRNKIHQLAAPQKEKLLAWLPKCESLDALSAWLDRNKR
jgi:predicted transposase YdaD